MPNTYTLLETISVGAAGAASVTFNSIPQTGYTDLVIKASTRSGSGGAVAYSMLMKINSLTSSIYSQRALEGNGAAASSFNQSGIDSAVRVALVNGTGATASTFSSTEITIPNYTSSNYKSISIDTVAETNATTTYMNMLAYLVQTTASVSSLTFAPEAAAATFAQHSTFSLYGVSALGTTPTKAPKATGGSIIQTDGTYWYHAFLSSGTFTPATGLSCDVLVVAGGGGGGNSDLAAGGGGAGGVYYSSTSVGASAQTITVGAGGAVNTNGSDSIFGSLTTAVGGGKGATSLSAAGSQGSGGGGAYSINTSGGTATSGQGSNGGSGTTSASYGVGGGAGGKGAAGSNGDATSAGNGGAGINTYSTWLSTTGLGVSGYIAGGGGGGIYDAVSGGSRSPGTGGSGGGGTGSKYWSSPQVVVATAGTANTGSGGGGAGLVSQGATGAAGGSGLVIIRYLAA